MEWTTERPTEPGFYFATDGSPILNVYVLDREGNLDIIAATFQSTWADRDKSYESYHMTPMPDMKYWCKIPVPDKPESHLTMLASEDVLRQEWDTPEEDEAWADLKAELGGI